MKKKIGFIGYGKMGSAIIKGAINSKFINNSEVFASDSSKMSAENKQKDFKIQVCSDNVALVNNVDVVFIATKPDAVRDVLSQIKSALTPDKLLVSIAAGIRLKSIYDIISPDVHTIRVMPNTPALLNEGMFGIAPHSNVSNDELDYICNLLSALGKVIVFPESQMDIVTALSGSGPAFFYKVIHEMALAAQKLGMKYDDAITLAAQTALGSAKMIMSSDKSPTQLIQSVATKGGCTEVGVETMNKLNSQLLLFDVIEKTTQKASMLGNN